MLFVELGGPGTIGPIQSTIGVPYAPFAFDVRGATIGIMFLTFFLELLLLGLGASAAERWGWSEARAPLVASVLWMGSALYLMTAGIRFWPTV